MAGLSFLRVVSNTDMVKSEQDAAVRAEADKRQSDPLILGLAAYLRVCWDAAEQAKKPIETAMLKALRQRNGQYEEDKLQAIRQQGGSQIYMMITEVKCRAAESWLRDILMDTGTPPWDIQPTPMPDLPPMSQQVINDCLAGKVTQWITEYGAAPKPYEIAELKEVVAQELRYKVLQEAQRRADRMKQKIADQFTEGGFAEAFNEFITDLVTYPAAVIKGPVVRRQRKLSWKQDAAGKTQAVTDEVLAPEFERVDPFRIYPEPGLSRIKDGYLFQHHPLSRSELADLIGCPGYDDASIRAVLADGTSKSWIGVSIEYDKAEQERRHALAQRPTDVYDALEFWGKVSGKMLLDWGMTDQEVPDDAREYDANVWVVGDRVIKAILNYDPLGEKPYAFTSFIRNPGALWGKGIPEIIEDLQNICNAAARSLVNNMGIASGPQVEVNLERVPPNEDITQIYPWRIWQVLNDPLGSSAPAVRFNQPTDNSAGLMGVYEKFAKLTDDHSGIPSYISGDLNVQGAGRTASGLSMLMGSAGKSIRQVVMHIDADILKHVVSRQFVYNMRYDPDESIKGDAQIVPKGAINLAVKDTVNVRRVEFLNATANDYDMAIIGKEGRAAILREVAKGLQMPEDEVVPTREKAEMQQHFAAMHPQQPPQGAPQAGLQPPAQGGVPTFAGGMPMGGAEGNTVSSRVTGQP